MGVSTKSLSFAESVCLVLVGQGVSHGWAVGSLLAPDGDVGRIWSLSRPLTYRAIDGLVAKRMVTRRGTRAGAGGDRRLLAATAAGQRAAVEWLDEPVEHLRDVRIELLLKLRLRDRGGLDNDVLLERQSAAFAERIDELTAVHPDDDLVALWRRESARAVRRFLDQARRHVEPPPEPRRVVRMSARNQLPATVVRVHHGAVMATVDAVLEERHPLTAAITREAALDLDLAAGDPVTMIIKSTEVIVAVGIDHPDAASPGRGGDPAPTTHQK